MILPEHEQNVRDAKVKLEALRWHEQAARRKREDSPEAKHFHDTTVEACKQAAAHLEEALSKIPLESEDIWERKFKERYLGQPA